MTMRVGVITSFLAVSLLSLSACSSSGVHQAETLSTPFPGTLLSIRAAGKCTADGCPYDYWVQITNPTQGDANVQDCNLPSAGIQLPIMGIGGFDIQAGATKKVRAHFLLPGVNRHAADRWVGQSLSCVGLDWHGDPPV
jgi:hypothetical protein